MTHIMHLAANTPLFTPDGQAIVALSAMLGEPTLHNVHNAMTIIEACKNRFDIAYAQTIANSRTYNLATYQKDRNEVFQRVLKLFQSIPRNVMESVHNDIIARRSPTIPANTLSTTSEIARHFPDTFGTAFQIAILPRELSGHFMPDGWTLTGPLTLEETPCAEILDVWTAKSQRQGHGRIPSIPSVTYDNGGVEKGILLGTVRDLPHEMIHLRQATSTNKNAQKNHLYKMVEEAKIVSGRMGADKISRAASLSRDLDSEQTLDSLVTFCISCTTVPLEIANSLMTQIGASRGSSIGAILSLAGILENHPDFIESHSESRIAYELVAYRHENSYTLPTFD